MHELIEVLRKQKLIEKTYGVIPADLQLGLPIWALNKPKDVFKAFVALSSTLSTRPLIVFVDDICPQSVKERTLAEQEDINSKYEDFFVPLGCRVLFSSRFLDEHYGNCLGVLRTIGKEVSLQQLINSMPEEKREMEDLPFAELFHPTLELAVLSYAKEQCNTIVMGRFSQRMAALYRSTVAGALPIIITPKFEGGSHTLDYINKLRKFS